MENNLEIFDRYWHRWYVLFPCRNMNGWIRGPVWRRRGPAGWEYKGRTIEPVEPWDGMTMR